MPARHYGRDEESLPGHVVDELMQDGPHGLSSRLEPLRLAALSAHSVIAPKAALESPWRYFGSLLLERAWSTLGPLLAPSSRSVCRPASPSFARCASVFG